MGRHKQGGQEYIEDAKGTEKVGETYQDGQRQKKGPVTVRRKSVQIYAKVYIIPNIGQASVDVRV
jgi:hypothetical protein